MIVKLLTEHHLEWKLHRLRMNLHLSKYHIVGNHMPGIYLSLMCFMRLSQTLVR